MAIGKWAKKKSRQATKAVGKRYGVSYGRKGLRVGKNSFSKIAKDVMMIKASLNVEKKFVDSGEVIKGQVGQVNQNTQGFLTMDLTPILPQGVQESQRVGNSVKLTGMVLKMNVAKQVGAGGQRRLKVYLVRSTDPQLAPNDVANKIMDVNPLSGVRDYHSNLDYTQLKDGRLKVLRTTKLFLDSNHDNSTNTPASEATTAVRTIALKLDDVLRFQDNASPNPENIRYTAVVVCDNGNHNASASTLLTIFSPEANSGCLVNAHVRSWYVDN